MKKGERVMTRREQEIDDFVERLKNIDGIWPVEFVIVVKMCQTWADVQAMPESKRIMAETRMMVLCDTEKIIFQPVAKSLDVPELISRIRQRTFIGKDLPTRPSLLEVLVKIPAANGPAANLKMFLVKALAMTWVQILQYKNQKPADFRVEAFLGDKNDATGKLRKLD